MTEKATEAQHNLSKGLDSQDPSQVLALLAASQVRAASVVEAAAPSIERAAAIVADTLRNGRQLIYVGAGSSGLMALADALELPGTYGIPYNQVSTLFAGGTDCLSQMLGGPEDDEDAARNDLISKAPKAGDCVICVTASGSTPYPLAAARLARSLGCKVIGIANNENAALFEHSDVSVALATPPEVIAGSTRMGAGTAQKIALNMLSTLAAIKLGHVHDGYMVNLVADNEKLRDRAARIVSTIANVSLPIAAQHLAQSNGAVKSAILLSLGAEDLRVANALLEKHGQVLRPAMGEIETIKKRLEQPA
jgi:N-acetylmuramic acid 6-phosphate etherase